MYMGIYRYILFFILFIVFISQCAYSQSNNYISSGIGIQNALKNYNTVIYSGKIKTYKDSNLVNISNTLPFSILIGHSFSDNFAIEAQYRYTKESTKTNFYEIKPKSSIFNTPTNLLKSTINQNYYFINAVTRYNVLTNRFIYKYTLYAKFGLGLLNYQYKNTDKNSNLKNIDSNKFTPAYQISIGHEFFVNPHNSVNLEYSYVNAPFSKQTIVFENTNKNDTSYHQLKISGISNIILGLNYKYTFS